MPASARATLEVISNLSLAACKHNKHNHKNLKMGVKENKKKTYVFGVAP